MRLSLRAVAGTLVIYASTASGQAVTSYVTINEPAIKAILAEVDGAIPVQLGGGIRDLDTIERYLDDGLSYIIIGTAAVKNPGFLRDACSAFGETG